MHTICCIPGDGIGREVVPAARAVLEATELPLRFVEAEAGWGTFERLGTSVPTATLRAVQDADATLAGAFTAPSAKIAGFQGAMRLLRNDLDLYANVRPARTRPVPGCFEGVDMLMVRESTEGLYVEVERRYHDIAIADVKISRAASARIARVAAQLARKRRGMVHVVHKANVLPITSGLFLDTAMDVIRREYPDVQAFDVIVDACAVKLVREPRTFDVLVTTNLFGDILSDLMAGLVGGLGIAPSANLGDRHAVFEPVHGSAPDIAGRGVANPTAAILTSCMMLDHLGRREEAARLESAVDRVLEHGPRTRDLGGDADTAAFTDAVIEAYHTA
jgi:homoisocitrate dehydrogenase